MLRQQRTAIVVELKALADPVEDLKLQKSLELVNSRTGRGLRKGQRVCSGRRGPRFRNESKDLQLAQRNTRGVSLSNTIN